jgi:hypothetical protein
VTRDEALKTLSEVYGLSSDFLPAWAHKNIDSYVALGMLKLDEPKLVLDRLYDQMASTAIGHHYATLLDAIDKAGLKLVEK